MLFPSNWHALSKQQVLEILELNKKHKKIASLEEYAVENIPDEKMVFENVVGQDSLTRFDRPKKKRNKNKHKKRRNKKKTNKSNA